MEEEYPKKEEFIPSDKPLPKYARALARLAEIEAQEAAGGLQFSEKDMGVELPDRPGKRIQEKFLRDREDIEATLNARGDSLYKNKRDAMRDQWSSGGMGWGDSYSKEQSSLVTSSLAGGEFNPRSYQGPSLGEKTLFQAPGAQANDFGGEMFGSGGRYGSTSNAEFTDDVYQRARSPEKENEENDENEYFDEDDEDTVAKGENYTQSRGGQMFNEYEKESISQEDVFGQGPLSSRPRDPFSTTFNEQSMNSMNIRDDGTEGQNMQFNNINAEGSSGVGEAVGELPERPEKQLREDFTRDKERLEAEINAKRDSIGRRGMPVNPDGGSYQPVYPGRGGPGKRIQSAQEIQTQLMLQKIAAAAFKASKTKGKKGKTKVVFI